MSVPFDHLPLGFRFRPTDEELINSYLKLKINGQIRPSDAAAIADVDVCRFEPWDLPAMSAIKSDDPEWFFFAPVDRKYPSGNRTNRSTLAGHWKATGNDRSIRTRAPGGARVVVGMKKTLVFHQGRAPRGKRTNWIMHEYRAVEPDFKEGGFVLCRLFRKPEETVSGTITSEPEEGLFAATPPKSYPGNTLHVDDVVVGEFSAALNQKSLEPNLKEESRPSPDTNNNQLTESKLHDKECYSIPYPNKPEESHSSGNMTTVEGGQMAERKEAALYDEMPAFLGAEYEHLFSDELPHMEGISSDVDHGLHTDISCFVFHQGLEYSTNLPTQQDGTSPDLFEVCAPMPEEYKEPSLRSRTRQIRDATSDAEIKPERLPLHHWRSPFRSVPIHRIGIAALVAVSLLLAGTVWFFH